MRLLKAKDFLRVIKGEDIEFRINPYEIRLKEPVVVEGVKSIYSLEFPKIKFNSITIKDCEFHGKLQFNELQGGEFNFSSSEVGELKLLNSRVNHVAVQNNRKIGALFFDQTDINNLSIARTRSFHRLHLGCHNNVLRATISHNGIQNTGVTDSSVYICPEQFGDIEIRDLNAAVVEIGSFGEHSTLTVDGVTADEFKIKDCDFSKSQVSLKNIKPMGETHSKVIIEDSVLDESVMAGKEIRMFNNLNIENSQVGSLQNMVRELKTLHRARFWKRSISSLFLW